jgi:hypothetical protein
LGRIEDVVPSTTSFSRYLFKFSEFACVNIPNAWNGNRNPVQYATLSDFGIDPTRLKWERMPVTTETDRSDVRELAPDAPLTIAQAKRGLAINYGVPSDAIEIVIRG